MSTESSHHRNVEHYLESIAKSLTVVAYALSIQAAVVAHQAGGEVSSKEVADTIAELTR